MNRTKGKSKTRTNRKIKRKHQLEALGWSSLLPYFLLFARESKREKRKKTQLSSFLPSTSFLSKICNLLLFLSTKKMARLSLFLSLHRTWPTESFSLFALFANLSYLFLEHHSSPIQENKTFFSLYSLLPLLNFPLGFISGPWGSLA